MNLWMREALLRNYLKQIVNITKRIGYYLKVYAGFVIENDFRKNGSSGGLTSWLLAELLAKGYVDGVVHVKPSNPEEGMLFKYSISTTIEEVKKGSESRYYPVEMSKVLEEVRNMPENMLL